MNQANDTMTRLASSLYSLANAMGQVEDDMCAYGAPAECARDAYHALRKQAVKTAQSFGYLSIDDALKAIEARTTGRWVYFSGLTQLC